MNNCNLTIIKAISVCLIYIYSGFKKTLISITSYLTVKFLINITVKSVNQVKFESTPAGGSVSYLYHLQNKYYPFIRLILRYTHSISLFFLQMFVRTFSSRPTLLLYAISFLQFIRVISYICSLGYFMFELFTKFDLQKFLEKYLNTDEFNKVYEVVDSFKFLYI